MIYDQLIRTLVQQGKEAEALEHLIKLMTLQKADEQSIKRMRTAFVRSGWRGVTLERIRIAEAKGNARPYDLARFYAYIKDKNNAFKYLERAHRERSNMIAVLAVDPEMDPLREDIRYVEFRRRTEGRVRT